MRDEPCSSEEPGCSPSMRDCWQSSAPMAVGLRSCFVAGHWLGCSQHQGAASRSLPLGPPTAWSSLQASRRIFYSSSYEGVSYSVIIMGVTTPYNITYSTKRHLIPSDLFCRLEADNRCHLHSRGRDYTGRDSLGGHMKVCLLEDSIQTWKP